MVQSELQVQLRVGLLTLGKSPLLHQSQIGSIGLILIETFLELDAEFELVSEFIVGTSHLEPLLDVALGLGIGVVGLLDILDRESQFGTDVVVFVHYFEC